MEKEISIDSDSPVATNSSIDNFYLFLFCTKVFTIVICKSQYFVSTCQKIFQYKMGELISPQIVQTSQVSWCGQPWHGQWLSLMDFQYSGSKY